MDINIFDFDKNLSLYNINFILKENEKKLMTQD